jgi:hypothetical protein
MGSGRSDETGFTAGWLGLLLVHVKISTKG